MIGKYIYEKEMFHLMHKFVLGHNIYPREFSKHVISYASSY
jgi:hypothetical protein